MNILVLGEHGQVASCLRQRLPDATYLGRSALDLEHLNEIKPALLARRPNFIINAAAYTAVDKAEEEVESAWRINAHAVREIAAAARELNAPLIHLSTDYVFPGTSERPYREDDPTDPVNQYGASKLQGEWEVRHGGLNRWWILRTSWVFSEFGHNFVKTMLRLARERDVIQVVDDQYGRPTYAGEIADAIVCIIDAEASGEALPVGIYHCASGGTVSWFKFAQVILSTAFAVGLLETNPSLQPISSANYPTPAARPASTILETSKVQQSLCWGSTNWMPNLNAVLLLLARHQVSSNG
ncbi:MAG: dTDP-4-dehydrorhamnose reductase [Gammaproteobacteria bacterium]|nr:dTDP-4-dehydrorhamnose reductase [Gammaproteobacteria bacterium]